MGFFDDLTGKSAFAAQQKGIDRNRLALDNFVQGSGKYLKEGLAKQEADYTKAIDAFNPYTTAGSSATTLYSDALGLNGADGSARATGAFQTGPGYQFAQDEAAKAGLRAASAGGMLASGNTLAALSDRAQGIADQEYGTWLDRLQGLSGQGLQAAGGQAGAYQGRGDVYDEFSEDVIARDSSVLASRMGLNTDEASLKAQEAASRGGLFGGLLKTGLSLGTKAFTGGMF